MKTLLLNGDYTPLSTISVERAMILLMTEKVEILHAKSGKYINTVKDKYPFPEVVRLKFFVYIKNKEIMPTKGNIFRRDGNTCQYCGSKKDLTIDHVVPVSKGGKSTWTNMVTACHKCNNKKGDKSLEEIGYKLHNMPRKPGFLNIFHEYYREHSLESWKDYIFIN